MKVCNVCVTEKDLAEFPKNKKSPDGHAWTCKKCNYIKVKEWRENNKEKRAIQSKRYQQKHPETRIRAVRKYRENHREMEREGARAYRQQNPEKSLGSHRRYCKDNKEKINLRARIKRLFQRDQNTARHREYIRKHPEKNRTYTQNWIRKRRAGGKFTDREWTWLLGLCGGKCLCPCELCDGTISRDHIDPDGLNVIENLQPLCRPCNSKKKNYYIKDFRPKWIVDNFSKLKAEAGL